MYATVHKRRKIPYSFCTMWRQPATAMHPAGVPFPSGPPCAEHLTFPVHRNNRLLAALPAGIYAQLAPELELLRLDAGCVLYEGGKLLQYAHFPIDSIVSLRYELADGTGGETAIAGNDGLIGMALLTGGQTTTGRAVVCSTGPALRINAISLLQKIEHDGPLQNTLLRYLQALITQTAQTTVCNRHHTLDQRLCRWLLLRLDRMLSNVLVVTHEQIAVMLGVRREGVTQAAGKLQAAGLIHYGRGRITILNRPGLEALVCECYAVVNREYDRLLPQITMH